MTAKHQRQQTMIEARRALVLDAARTVFDESGMQGANIREIAKRAGYTPGAIYSYFDSKESIYGALLAESLERLHVDVAQARTVKNKPEKTLLAKSLAWFGFFANNPRDLDLTFYLIRGMKARGLPAEIKRPLDERLRDALRPGEAALLEMGLNATLAARESAALFAHGMGVLLLPAGSPTLLGQSPESMFQVYLEQLLSRYSAAGGSLPADEDAATGSPQVDLFA